MQGVERSTYCKDCAEARAASATPVRRGDPGYALKFDRYGEKSVMNKLAPKYLIAAGSCLAAVVMFLAGQEGVGRLLLLSIIPLLYFF